MPALPAILVNGNSVNGPAEWGSRDYTNVNQTPSTTDFSADGLASGSAQASTSFAANSYLLGSFPSDLANVDTLTVTVSANRTSSSDDQVLANVRIVKESNGAVLAAALADGTYEAVVPQGRDGLSATPLVYGPVSFTYVNTTATLSDWDDARVEIQARAVAQMGSDAERNFGLFGLSIGGTYSVAPAGAMVGVKIGGTVVQKSVMMRISGQLVNVSFGP